MLTQVTPVVTRVTIPMILVTGLTALGDWVTLGVFLLTQVRLAANTGVTMLVT